MMNAAAPDGTPPRRFRSLPLFKPLAQRGPDEAAERPPKGGLTLKNYKKRVSNFHTSGANSRSCSFQLRHKFLIFYPMSGKNGNTG